METAARYTETKIKTYGFEIKLGRCMVAFSLDPASLVADAGCPPGTLGQGIPFEMLFMVPCADHRCRMSVVVAPHHRTPFARWLMGIEPRSAGIDLVVTEPIELLYFFGPHYGDRFGIADFTFRTLAECGIPVIASAFSSASVFLVLPEHGAQTAKSMFAERFEIPATIQRPSFFAAGHAATIAGGR